MQKILLMITIGCLFICNSCQALTTNEYVNALEKKLFGITYENQSMNERVDRIEMQIYDNHYTGKPEERLNKIDKIYPKSEFETGQIQHPKNLSFENYSGNEDYYEQDYPEKPQYNNYPIISEIEQNVYKRNYQGEDIYVRLSRLEKELYGNVKEDMTLQERVENLKAILPKKHFDVPKDIGFKDFGLNSSTDYTNGIDKNLIINELETETFHKTFKNENLTQRLERLEQYYFGTIIQGQSDEERLNKIAMFALNSQGYKNYFPTDKGAQWAGILMNILMIGLSFLL